MDRSHNYVSKLKKLCRSRADGFWSLLAIAAGDMKSVELGFKAVSSQELEKAGLSTISGSPSIVALRIEALSVQFPNDVIKLLDEYKKCENQNDWIKYALYAIQKLQSKVEVDSKLPPWSWSDQINSQEESVMDLSMRPIIDERLSYEKFWFAVQNAPYLLKAIQYQNVEISSGVFEKILSAVSGLDPYYSGLIVELSRKSGFDQSKFAKIVINMYQNARDARDLIPLAYAVLNSSWHIP